MGKLLKYTTEQNQLYDAWRKIRENGYASRSEETRQAVELFERTARRGISRIQKRIRSNTFTFDPQIGVPKKKTSGKRGIVMATVQNRIVERALLDCLQLKSPYIKSVINLTTSVGGVPERSVPHGLKLIDECIQNGFKYFVRSDISGFFDSVPRDVVLQKIAADVEDSAFLSLLNAATTVTLANEQTLGEDRRIFPTGYDGVAQGSPLSPLFGNILLYDFDLQFNKDGVVCIRFIDDFVLLSKEERKTRKAFENAKKFMKKLGLNCHDPFVKTTDKSKASAGLISDGFDFLGYNIRPGLIQPCAAARKDLLLDIRGRIVAGKANIRTIARDAYADNSQRYVQTLSGIDRALRGWGNAFAYSNATSTIEQLDQSIDEELKSFRSWFAEFQKNCDWKTRRRTCGVCLLSDIRPKQLSEVPFKIEPGGRFVKSSKTVTISTDGSVISSKRNPKDTGPGGWAYVVHETGMEQSGSEAEATNQQMELRAVIEGIKATPGDKSILVRTDSQYVCQLANGNGVVRVNTQMWKEFQGLRAGRKIKVVWVKGHAGCKYNERADVLAGIAASKGKKAAGSIE